MILLFSYARSRRSIQIDMANPAYERGFALIDRVRQTRTTGVPFIAPKKPLRTTEAFLVRDILQMLQGYASKSFSWDESSQRFHFEPGIHVSHLSQSSLSRLVHCFVCAATSLRRIEAFAKIVATASCNAGHLKLRASPTLQAFANAASLVLERLRRTTLEKELLAVGGGAGTSVTLLSLSASLSWVCAGAEFLEQVVNEAIPHKDILHESGMSAVELCARILSYLYNKMSEFCLLQDGEEEPYGTLLMLFAGSLRPLTESLDAWLHEGILSDPFGELFFSANKTVAIEDAAFWQHGYNLRYHESWSKADSKKEGKLKKAATISLSNSSRMYTRGFLARAVGSSGSLNAELVTFNGEGEKLVCPNFLQPIANAILSTGKSLQLLQHVRRETAGDSNIIDPPLVNSSFLPLTATPQPCYQTTVKQHKLQEVQEANNGLYLDSTKGVGFFESHWHQWSIPASRTRNVPESLCKSRRLDHETSVFSEEMDKSCETSTGPFAIGQQNPVFHISDDKLEAMKCEKNSKDIHLNLLETCMLPPLNDEILREAIFTDIETASCAEQSTQNATSGTGMHAENRERFSNNQQYIQAKSFLKGTDYGNGSGCGSLLMRHTKTDFKAMERLFSFPTLLPSSKEGSPLFNMVAAQRQNRVASAIFELLQKAELKVMPLPDVLVQECLILPIQKQVEAVGKRVLDRLMGEWRLMEELSVVRAVYLIGSGDLLQQFSSVLFNKLDRGEPWDDFYELNTMLQESVRSSADGMLLPALDSLVVTIQPRANSGIEPLTGPVPLHFAGRNSTFGIDTLDSLFFVYKVAWPLELIIDGNAIKKYNQVMAFLFKVKRAKFALDKACRWMWKNGGGDSTNLKQQLLLQQKLMHFVNTLHQYVMDRVLYSAWLELCEGMASAASLDEVIVCHDAYLVSIQRQCLVAPDKLWALISSRVKTILGLALDFYSIQRTLCGGGAAPAIKARCQLEIERVGRQFDECIVFLLRVLSFKLNVGHFPHLAELVTRINFNFYYVSESGHLLTPLPEINIGRGSQIPKTAVHSHG